MRSSSGTGRPCAAWTSSGAPEPRGDPLHDERARGTGDGRRPPGAEDVRYPCRMSSAGTGDGRRPPGAEDRRYPCERPDAFETDPNLARFSLAHALCNQTYSAYASRAPNPDGAQGAWPPRGPCVQHSGPSSGSGARYPSGDLGGFDGRGACEGDLGGFDGRGACEGDLGGFSGRSARSDACGAFVGQRGGHEPGTYPCACGAVGKRWAFRPCRCRPRRTSTCRNGKRSPWPRSLRGCSTSTRCRAARPAAAGGKHGAFKARPASTMSGAG